MLVRIIGFLRIADSSACFGKFMDDGEFSVARSAVEMLVLKEDDD